MVHLRHYHSFIKVCQLPTESQVYGDKDLPSRAESKPGSCSVYPSYVFHSPSQKQRHYSIFHHDYKPDKTVKRARRNHQCNCVENDKECCLLFPSLKKLQAHRKLKNHHPKRKKVTIESRKMKIKYSKGIITNIKEYFSFTETMAVSHSNANDKQKIEVQTNDHDDEGVLCFIYNDEEEDNNIEDDMWLQCNNCNL